MSLSVEMLTSLIAQLDAQRKRTEAQKETPVDDINNSFRSGELIQGSAFSKEQLLEKRKKREKATEAQQTFSVSTVFLILPFNLLYVKMSYMYSH